MKAQRKDRPAPRARIGRCHQGALSLALGLTGMLLVSCGEEEAPVQVEPTVEPARVAQAVKAAEKKDTESQVYTYNAIGKRDPFRTYFAELAAEETSTKNLTELQQYDLDQLKLVAVIVGTATPKAMVEDPEGKGHIVKTGTLIGKHWGQVKHIRRGEIIIQEEFRDFTGRRITNLVPLKLPEEKQN